ncbi:hypothetical protein [Streptomyces scabichelini]|nr:hypothetical protein [Streptomyces scabichelini]
MERIADLTAHRELRDRGLVVTLLAKGSFVAYPQAEEPAGGEER